MTATTAKVVANGSATRAATLPIRSVAYKPNLGGQMNITKALYEFLIATLPAVIVYFIGWAYLFFFLSDFSINITELNFDTTTVFIYAFAPIQIFVKNHWLLTLVGILVAFILFLSCQFACQYTHQQFHAA